MSAYVQLLYGETPRSCCHGENDGLRRSRSQGVGWREVRPADRKARPARLRREKTWDQFRRSDHFISVNALKITLLSALFLGAGVAGCDKKDSEDSEAKANDVCGADEKAKAEGSACKACCADNGVTSYQFDGMNNTCTCG